MNLLLVVLGTAVLVVVTIDQFATIAGTGAGSGLIVHRLNDGLWRLALRLHRIWPSHRRLAVVGTCLLVLTPLVWILGLWVGWTAIFAASTDAVVDGQGREPATLLGRIYFAGFSLFTLGLGDLHPGTDGWRMLTVLAALMGLAMVTLSITYLVPVVQAATAKASLSRTLGQFELADETGARSDDQSAVIQQLTSVVVDINEMSDAHLTHQALRYYHAVEDAGSLAVQVCKLHLFLSSTEEVAGADEAVGRDRLRRAALGLAGSITRKPVRDDLSSTYESLLAHDGRTDHPIGALVRS
jgi:hypothetical protein